MIPIYYLNKTRESYLCVIHIIFKQGFVVFTILFLTIFDGSFISELTIQSIMATSERVTVRVSEDQLSKIQALVDEGVFDTVTDVIRCALDEYLAQHFSPENMRKVSVDLPRRNVLELETLVKDGDSISLDDAIRDAVREYTRSRVHNI